jgi:hypothetical protein
MQVSKMQFFSGIHNKCCKLTTNRASSVPSMIAPIKGSFLFEEFDETGIVTETHIKNQHLD